LNKKRGALQNFTVFMLYEKLGIGTDSRRPSTIYGTVVE
jgi:hypothetical protein